MRPPAQLAKTVDEYLERIEGWRADVASELREMVHQTLPSAEEGIGWGQIVFELDGPVCFIKAFRNQVNFGFWRGDQLTDPHRVLEKSSDQMKFVKLIPDNPIRKKELTGLLKHAARLNREYGDPTKRS